MAFSRFAESKESSLSSGNHTVVFEDRYYLKRFLKKTSNFYMYEGIDKAASKYVFIYMKPVSQPRFRSIQISASTKRLRLNSGPKLALVYYGKEVINKILPLLMSKSMKNMDPHFLQCSNTSRKTSVNKTFCSSCTRWYETLYLVKTR